MRAFDIALVLVIFTGVSGVIADLGIVSGYDDALLLDGYSDDDFANIDGEIISDDETLQSTEIKLGVTSLFEGIRRLDDYVMIKTIIMKTFTTSLDPASSDYANINNIANVVQVACGMIYMFAVIQLWRKVSIKHME